MAYTGRSRDTIRAEILSQWAAEYAARGYTLLTSRSSDAYLTAGAVAVELEGLEAQAEQTTRDILPDQASEEALERHGYVFNVPRLNGERASLTVTVTSAIADTYPVAAGTQMVYSDGTLYNVTNTSVVTSGGSPSGTINVTAVDAGADGTREVADTLTFVSAPAGLNSTGAVASVVTSGTDEEAAADWAQRIVDRLRDRPASGNRADWRSWVRDYTGTDIEDAYVYPLLSPPKSYPGAGTADTPGTVTVIPMGPVQGDSTTNTRLVPTDDASTRSSGAELTRIADYIEGTREADGTTASPVNDPLRPASLPAGNYSIEAVTLATAENVIMALTVTDTNAPSWSGTMTVVSATASTLVVSGNQTANANKTALVNIDTANYRGGFKQFALGSAAFGGVNTTFTITDQATIATAVAASTVYPAPGNWAALRTAAFAYFDALGPGDTTPASRWPSEDTQGRSTLYRTALAAAMFDVDGVLSASTTSPGSDVVADPKKVIPLGTFAVTC